MKTRHLLFILLGAGLLFACEKSSEDIVITKSVFSGYVQKGPYINGSSVTITLLDEHLNQTGMVFSTQIIDNSGNFEQKNMELTSNFVELKADGYYFNEVKGENSTGSLTLYALADITDVNSVNINILTHLERQRISYLVQNDNLSFSDAKKQARREVLDIFKFALPDDIAAESLDIVDNALLLAVSAIVQGHLSTGDMSELLANISADIRTDGKLDNPVLGSQLMNNAVFIALDQVKTNMENKYSGLGINVNVNSDELKGYVDQFKNNSGFSQTSSITYPETGKYGPNILADDFVTAKRTESDRFEYSVKAVLPAGASSLKIVIKSKTPFVCSQCGNVFTEQIEKCPICGEQRIYAIPWGGFNQGSDDNWLVTNTGSHFTFTVVESGKPADASVIFFDDCIIEYYENGAIEPTKVKEIKVVP